MKRIKIQPSKLEGSIIIPPSKSLSHRAIICATLCNTGESIIDNVILSDDIKASISAMKALGASIKIEEIKENKYRLKISRYKTSINNTIIHCDESGSTLRFLIPIALVLSDINTFTGAGRLIERPLDPYYKIFEEQGILYSNDNGKLPLKTIGRLKSSNFTIEGDTSSQFISGLLMALPLLDGDSKLNIINKLESKPYVDLTIDMLRKFGIDIINNNYEEFIINGNSEYKATNYQVESDYSQAAFYLGANFLGNNINCLELNEASIQGDKEIISIIEKMSSLIENEIRIDVSQIPDLVPIIAVVASCLRDKTTYIENAKRLRIKESDRLFAISSQLNKIGADIKELEDGLVIKGKASLNGCLENEALNSFNDHRIAMALAIAATKCKNSIVIDNYEVVSKSYPSFWTDYIKLGGLITEIKN